MQAAEDALQKSSKKEKRTRWHSDSNRNDEQDGKGKQEKEKKKNITKEKRQVEELGSRLGKSHKSSDYGWLQSRCELDGRKVE